MDFDSCPYCGRRIVKGAMRCLGCGKILKSPEDQMDSINRIKESRKKINLKPIVKLVFFLIVIAIVYNKFSDQIDAIIQRVMGK